jgi:hypothetical protein
MVGVPEARQGGGIDGEEPSSPGLDQALDLGFFGLRF